MNTTTTTTTQLGDRWRSERLDRLQPGEYLEDGVIFEDSGLGLDRPLRPICGGDLGRLLWSIANLDLSVVMGDEYVAEMTAEHGASWVTSGFSPEDAMAYASQETSDARRILGNDKAELYHQRRDLEALYPVHTVEAPMVLSVEPF